MRHAFTLIELMIVIAIIGILACIAVPNYIAYQNRQKCGRNTCDEAVAVEITQPKELPKVIKLPKGERFVSYSHQHGETKIVTVVKPEGGATDSPPQTFKVCILDFKDKQTCATVIQEQ